MKSLETPGIGKRLNSLYGKLAAALEGTEDRLFLAGDSAQDRVCLTILEDDLVTLVEECENYLIGGYWPKKEELESFESRAFCILEELDSVSMPAALIATTAKHTRARHHSP